MTDEKTDYFDSLHALTCSLYWLVTLNPKECHKCVNKHLTALHQFHTGTLFTVAELDGLFCQECEKAFDTHLEGEYNKLVDTLKQAVKKRKYVARVKQAFRNQYDD